MDALEKVLKQCRTKFVIVDDIYSQDGNLAPLNKILQLTKQYGAYLIVDDVHGTGVIGKTGRGGSTMTRLRR